jgi:hypothetical protein
VTGAASWRDFESAAPELAEVGARLLHHPNRGEVGILATVDASGRPRVAPVCPIFCGDGVYLSVGAHTPKLGDLRRTGRYALHAQVGADDLEFQISGVAREVTDAAEHERVVAAIPFPSYNPHDPVFELEIERALVVTWPEGGERGSKQAWAAG